MNYSNLMDAVNARIKANGRREITGDILNDVLRAMVVELGAGYQLGGTIRPGDKPKDEDLRVAYLAVEPGMYLYAGGFEVTELSLITYGAEWHMYPLGVPFGTQIAEDIAAAVEVEKTRAMSAEKDLSDAIDTEKTERAAADSALDTAIKAEAKRATEAEGANASAITAEADARAKADIALQGNITAEETARTAADQTLQANIDKKVSKDDDTWLENFMPRIILNKNGTVKSVSVGDNVAADYSTISTRLSRYGGVVTGAVAGYQDEPILGRVVQVFNDGEALYVTAIFNYAENFSREFANSIYEIVLNYNSEGEFVSGTYKFKQIGEVFQIKLSARSSSEMAIDKTYEDFQKIEEDYLINGALPLIILNDTWTGSSFILTRYHSQQAGNNYIFQLSFISVREKELVGYYIVIEKDKTTITPFEFQPTTKDELDEAIAAMNTSVDEKIAQFQNDVGEALGYLDAEIGKKQDIISDMDAIRTNAANGHTAFGWGDHAKAGYTKAFIVNITGDGSTENPYAVDKTREEVAAALAANSLILLKVEAADFQGYFEIYHLIWATNYPTQALMLQFGNIDEASHIYTTMVLIFSYQEGVGVNVKASSTKLATDEQVKAKQDTLASGKNIKTINGESILGAGDLPVGVPTMKAGRERNSEVFNGIDPSNARGSFSHAEGDNTHSMGFASHAEGSNTIATNEYSHAEGLYNVADFDAIHSVGIGTGSVRKDAHRITYDGKHYIPGIGGFDGTKATENLTNEKDLATVINEYETRIAALETALASIKSN